MPTYLDVAAVRIQPYLGRTPRLRLRRGASWMITRATSQTAVTSWIESLGISGVKQNPDAGHADGVVSLEVAEDSEQRLAENLLLHLRAALPASDLQALWATAPAYLEARKAMSAQRANPLLALPALADFPSAATCRTCRVDPATDGDMCPDCAERDTAAGRRYRSDDEAGPDGEADALGVEREVLDVVNAGAGRALLPVRHLEDLANLGRPDGNRNHVATVAIDGNGMGGFFDAIDHEGSRHLKKEISPAIAGTTLDALHQAVRSIVADSDKRLPAVPHVLGGDDVVVSVPADRAWAFSRAFLDAFARGLIQVTGELEMPTSLRALLPSVSAGIVFAHYKFPYARAAHLAEESLRKAKHDARGAEPALSWLDVTVDGEEIPSWRTTVTLSELDSRDVELRTLGAIESSGRQVLARLLAGPTDDEVCAAALSWARRNDHAVVTRLLGDGTAGALRNLVAMTRWY